MLCCKWHYFVLFYGWVIFRCMSVPDFLYPLICWWPFRLVPCLGNCEQCCSEHKLAYIFLSYSFVWIYMPWSRMVGSYSNSIFMFFRDLCQRRKWHPTPVFLPGKSQGWRSLVGCRQWGRRESDTTERLSSSSSKSRNLCLFSTVAVRTNISTNSIRGLGRHSRCFLTTHQITSLKLCRFYWLYLLDISKSFPPIWSSCSFPGSSSHYLFPGWSPSLMTCWPVISIGQIHFLRWPPGWSLRITNVMQPLTCVKWSEVAQSCLTLCDPMDYSLPDSSVHGISQARVLEWVAISFSNSPVCTYINHSNANHTTEQVTTFLCVGERHFIVWLLLTCPSCATSHLSL